MTWLREADVQPVEHMHSEFLDVIDAIRTTRAMRRLKPTPVRESLIWEIIDAATCGPSSGNVQRWGWVVVTDPDVKQQVARWYLDAWNQLGRPGRRAQAEQLVRRLARRTAAVATPGDENTDPNMRSGSYLAHHIAEAPVWVFAVQRGISGTPNLVDGADIFGAVQNLMLAARKHGLGSTLTMLHRTRERDVARILGLPSDARTVALIPLGYPMSGFSRPRRKPVETVTHWERWGNLRVRPIGVGQEVRSG